MNSDTHTENDTPALGTGELHVWRIPLKAAPPDRIYWDVLSPEEQQRAERFRMDDVRRRFVIAHGALRHILSRYVESDPAHHTFTLGENGKPMLVTPTGRIAPLHFNLSHSGEIALAAVASGSAVGVDIECIRRDADWHGIAKRFFTTGECEYIASLVGDEQIDAFFNCWTRKEAFLKALGLGIASGIDRFSVDVAAAEPAKPIILSEAIALSGSWHIVPLEVPEGYASAAAVTVDIGTVRYFDYRSQGGG